MQRIDTHLSAGWRVPTGFSFLLLFLLTLGGCCCGGGGGSNRSRATGSGQYSGSYDTVRGVNSYFNAALNKDIQTVAVIPFTAPTELIGASISDLVVTELLRLGRYKIVERGQISKVLGETELALAGVSTSKAMEVGQMTGAEAVIVGSVSEYEMAAYKGRRYPSVGLSLRCIDSSSGEIIWSADYTERTDKKNISLSGQARKVVHAIASTLHNQGLNAKKRR